MTGIIISPSLLNHNKMKPKKIWANFSVKDVNRTREFYAQLGIKANGPNNQPKFASFLFGDDNFIIHFFEQGSQIDEYINTGSNNGSEIIFTLSARFRTGNSGMGK